MPILSPKLKPCANCGGRGKFHIVSDQRSKNWNGEYIECSNIQCGISTPIMFPAMESVKEALAESAATAGEECPKERSAGKLG